MMDLGDSSVCKKYTMICTDTYSDNKDEDIAVYGDQGISSIKYEEDMYGELMNTDCNEEKNVKSYVHKTVCHWKRSEDG